MQLKYPKSLLWKFNGCLKRERMRGVNIKSWRVVFKKYIILLLLTLFISCSQNKTSNNFIDCGVISFRIDTNRFSLPDTTIIAPCGLEVLFNKIIIKNNTNYDVYFSTLPIYPKFFVGGVVSTSTKYGGWSGETVYPYHVDSSLLKLQSNTIDTFIMIGIGSILSFDTVKFEIGYFKDCSKKELVKIYKKLYMNKKGKIKTKPFNKII